MNAPLIARVLGALFLIAGVAGLLPWVSPAPAFDARVILWDNGYRMLFGVFPVNLVHDGLHALLGVWGLASGRFKAGVFYCRCVFWIYLVLVILGSIPFTATLLGYVPIYGWDVLLHFVALVLCAYGGYGRGSLEAEEPAASGG